MASDQFFGDPLPASECRHAACEVRIGELERTIVSQEITIESLRETRKYLDIQINNLTQQWQLDVELAGARIAELERTKLVQEERIVQLQGQLAGSENNCAYFIRRNVELQHEITELREWRSAVQEVR